MLNKHMLPTLGPKTPDFRKRCKNVPGVTNDSMKIVAWMSIWLATVERNHIRTMRFPPICVHAVHEMYICFWFWKASKNGPGVTNDSIETVAWMSIWLATVETNHLRTNLKNYMLLSNMRFCMWFIRFLSVSIIFSHSSHERFKLSLEGTYDLHRGEKPIMCFSAICSMLITPVLSILGSNTF